MGRRWGWGLSNGGSIRGGLRAGGDLGLLGVSRTRSMLRGLVLLLSELQHG